MIPSDTIAPGGALGVLGGGQLGAMFVHAAQAMGWRTVVLDPDANCPAGAISQQHICADYADAHGLTILASACAAVTTEFENVPAAALEILAHSVSITPTASAVAIAQDRAREKAHFVQCGVPVAPHTVIEIEQQLTTVDTALLPGILKTARLGYDGKGQVHVTSPAELAAAWQQLGQVPCVLERLLPLVDECSVIIARSRTGSVVHLPVQRNMHRNGILAVTEVYDGLLSPAVVREAVEAATTIANGLDYVGVLCVEFFLLQNGQLVVNEIAPRPHNSGHYSQDACDISQFELQVRCMTGMPLIQPRQHSPAVMLNLLGDLWFNEAGNVPIQPAWERVLALPGCHLHLYGKTQARRGRKMGHLNITADTVSQARATALQAAALLGIAPF